MNFDLVEVPGGDMEEKLKKVEINVIITPTTWKFMEQDFFFSRWLTLHPYKWDRALKAQVVASKLSYWRLQLVTAVVFYMLLLIRLVEVVIVGPGSMVEQTFTFSLSYRSTRFLFWLKFMQRWEQAGPSVGCRASSYSQENVQVPFCFTIILYYNPKHSNTHSRASLHSVTLHRFLLLALYIMCAIHGHPAKAQALANTLILYYNPEHSNTLSRPHTWLVSLFTASSLWRSMCVQ